MPRTHIVKFVELWVAESCLVKYRKYEWGVESNKITAIVKVFVRGLDKLKTQIAIYVRLCGRIKYLNWFVHLKTQKSNKRQFNRIVEKALLKCQIRLLFLGIAFLKKNVNQYTSLNQWEKYKFYKMKANMSRGVSSFFINSFCYLKKWIVQSENENAFIN